MVLDALDSYGNEFCEAFERIVNSKAAPIKKIQKIFNIPYKFKSFR